MDYPMLRMLESGIMLCLGAGFLAVYALDTTFRVLVLRCHPCREVCRGRFTYTSVESLLFRCSMGLEALP